MLKIQLIFIGIWCIVIRYKKYKLDNYVLFIAHNSDYVAKGWEGKQVDLSACT